MYPHCKIIWSSKNFYYHVIGLLCFKNQRVPTSTAFIKKWLHATIQNTIRKKLSFFLVNSCWNVEFLCSWDFELRYFFATDFIRMRLLHRKSAKFTLFSRLTILNVWFFSKLIEQTSSFFVENRQKLHIFRNWLPKKAFLFSWFL